MQEVTKEISEKKEILRRYKQLLRVCKSNLEKGDKEMIRSAFNLALEAHKDMRRKSGEPYIYHPIAVAQICAEEIGLGPTSIVCALLHDVVEDTYITLENIKFQFGDKIATIVDGLTKISSSLYDGSTGSVQAENFRKMLLTLSDDVRVILIKLADRLHNMRTLDSMSRNTQLKIASETIYIYAPLAHRLGLYGIKTELEDLAVKYTESKLYKSISEKLSETKLERNKFIKHFIEPIKAKLDEASISFDIKGRPKSIYSIMKKMNKQNIPFEEVYDLFAIRIIVNSSWENEKSDCFKSYGIVTDMYTPNPARFRDWISTPKANGYESLHTTVMSNEGKWVEVQIRSKRMDEIAEKGYAAHWKYKEQTSTKNAKHDKAGKNTATSPENVSGLDQWLATVRELLENPETNAIDFLDDFKQNFFSDEVFIFTPKGELRKLPANSTTLDFAYEIHSDVGNKCIGAKVNNKLVPLSHKLKNGDQVEILTSQKQSPNEDWLNFVTTGKAKQRIREYFKEDQRKIAIEGKDILERKFKNAKLELSSDNLDKVVKYFNLNKTSELYILIGKGTIKKTDIILNEILDYENNKIFESKNKSLPKKTQTKISNSDTILIDDSSSELAYSFGTCCNPIPGDEIFGFVTIGEGIKIHQTNCPSAVDLMANYGYRILKARWSNNDPTKQSSFLASIKISGIDSVGIVRGITDVISKQLQVNMKSINIDTIDGKFEGSIQLYIYDTSHLEELMNNIKKVEGIYSVVREK